MKVFLVVAARGGSNGMPRNNLQIVFGRPVVALAAEAVDDVVVNTDDNKIAPAASAEVPFRWSAELAREEIQA